MDKNTQTFARNIEKAADGEKIEAIVIGRLPSWSDDPGDDGGSARIPGYTKLPFGVLLSWGDARPLLSFAYDAGFGCVGCPAVYVWTKTRVLFVSQYDGATSISSVPRNPVACSPEMSGGG